MVWLKIKLRSTAARGRVKIALPPIFSDHGFIRSPSFAPAIAFRAVAVLLSKAASTSSRDLRGWFGGASATSNESLPIMASVHFVIVAQGLATPPQGSDFTCGFPPKLSL